MKLDIKSESGIAKSYQLPCLVPMGTARLVRNILKPNIDTSGRDDETMVTELAMGIRLLRTIVMDTIDPRAEDFVFIVRDSTVVFRGVTLEIKDETGQVLNRPRSTSIKIPIAKFSRFFGFKGTHIQLPLKPLRVFVGLAAGLFLGNSSTMRNGLVDLHPQGGGGGGSSDMMGFDLDDEPQQFEVELVSGGTKTRIQSKSLHKGVSSGEFQFIFDFASKTRTDPRRESTRIEHSTEVQRPLATTATTTNTTTAAAAAAAAPVLATTSATTIITPASRHRSGGEESATTSLRSSNNSFGRLIGRSLNTPHGSENSFFTPDPGDEDYGTAAAATEKKSTGSRKRSHKDDSRDHFAVTKRSTPTAAATINNSSSSSNSSNNTSRSGRTATNKVNEKEAEEEEETYFRHARNELPKLTTLNHRSHLQFVDTHDSAPGPSIGWGEPAERNNSDDNENDTNNMNYDTNNNDNNDYVEEDREDEADEETPAQLLSTRPVLHDLGNSGIGPTQQSTFAKGIFD